MTEPYDITIIGAGPVGLFGAFYAGLRGMRTLVIDSLDQPGGQLAALYPEKYIFDMPGFPKVLAKDLARDMISQGTRFEPQMRLGERVDGLLRLNDGTFEISTNRAVYSTRTAVICAGAGAFEPKRLSAPGVADLQGRGVEYFVAGRDQFAGKRILIVGGGDSALDWAMNLEPIAASITLIHRRDVFRAHEESVDWLLNRSTVTTRLFWEISRLEGTERLERAVIKNSKTGEELALDVDACLINIGFNADIGPIRNWGIEQQANQVLVNSRMETSLPGIYAAGDICTYDGKLKLIATGVGEVCVAVNFAKVRIDPRAKAFPGHTSNMDL